MIQDDLQENNARMVTLNCEFCYNHQPNRNYQPAEPNQIIQGEILWLYE